MPTKLAVDTDVGVFASDALRELCYADALFRQRYEGWRLLGRGPWATVVGVRSRDLRQDIALKIFVNIDPELLARVRQEVRAVQALATPYLVQAHSLFDRGSIAWFEMELVDGPNLAQALDRNAATGSRFAVRRAYEIALAVSRGLWHAHQRGVLHRDIKPANVLLPSSEQPAAKLGDFGIAHIPGLTLSTPRDVIVGTPRFASPEALAGRDVGPPHDVYGLGLTLYALMTGGRPPYEIVPGATLAELKRIQATTRPLAIQALTPEVDPNVDAALMLALAGNPTQRPSPGDVVRALERALSGRALVTRGNERW